jgi:hypothetical protein
VEAQRLSDVYIGSSPDQQKVDPGYAANGIEEVWENDDVRIEITEQRMLREARDLGKDRTQEWCAEGIAFNLWKIDRANHFSKFTSPLLIRTKHNPATLAQACPALDGVLLNYSYMTRKWLRHSEQRQHTPVPCSA